MELRLLLTHHDDTSRLACRSSVPICWLGMMLIGLPCEPGESLDHAVGSACAEPSAKLVGTLSRKGQGAMRLLILQSGHVEGRGGALNSLLATSLETSLLHAIEGQKLSDRISLPRSWSLNAPSLRGARQALPAMDPSSDVRVEVQSRLAGSESKGDGRAREYVYRIKLTCSRVGAKGQSGRILAIEELDLRLSHEQWQALPGVHDPVLMAEGRLHERGAPKRVAELLKRGDKLRDANDVSAARRYYRDALRLDWSNVGALMRMGHLEGFCAKRPAVGRAYYRYALDQLVQQSPDERLYIVRINTACLCVSEGDLDQAEELLRKVMDSRPDDVRASVNMAVLLLARQEYDPAIRLLSECQSAKGLDAYAMGVIHYNLGSACLALGRVAPQKESDAHVRQAHRHFTTALEHISKTTGGQRAVSRADVYGSLGTASLYLGRCEDATSWYERAVSSPGVDDRHRRNLACAYMRGQKPDKALDVLNRSQKSTARTMLLKGRILAMTARWSQAADAVEVALKGNLDPLLLHEGETVLFIAHDGMLGEANRLRTMGKHREAERLAMRVARSNHAATKIRKRALQLAP